MSGEATTARRVLVIAGVVVIAANLRTAISAIGPVLDPIRGDVGLSAGAAGFIVGTLPLLTFGAVSPLVVPLTRRLGTDRALWLGLAVLLAGVVLRSLPVTALLWAGTILLAAGVAVGNVLLPSVITRDFPDRIGQMTGVYAATAGIAAALASGVTVPLADVLPGGWRSALGVWAGLVLVALGVWAPRAARRREPSGGETPRTDSAAAPVTGLSPWRSPLAWEVAAFMALASAGFYTVITWYPTILKDLGTGEASAGWLLSLYQLLGVVMNVAVPLLIRRMADQRTIAAGASAILVVGYAGLVLWPGLAWLWVTVTGLGAGAAFLLALTFFSLRAADERSAASLAGMGQAIAYLFAATWPLLFGVLYDTTGGWTLPLWTLAALAAAQTIVSARAGRDARFRATPDPAS
ncbi:hypothetical protein BJF79_06325 [Actinomadura sp. CNU-125]|uniref:CynX/NimT family MFS transporter n=1 Tax=Actinomadura sp. CNU-125 TaxID=1904961 RepID=UPI00095FADBC|nr:MFS transporter [Actinomadura sp. CNU-125]OLT36985.1 hypothetical protein BJF79_06325 [Actinomadura sp. CNU-125]